MRSTSHLSDNLVKPILVVTALVLAWYAGRALVTSPLFFALALSLLSALVLGFPFPRLGFYLAYPLLFLVPFEGFRLDFLPIFRSPLNILVTTALGLAVLRAIVKRQRLPRSPLYWPLIYCVSVLVLYTMIGHGDAPGRRLLSVAQPLWPFVLTILLIQTPRQAGLILRIALGCIVVYTALWFPLLVTAPTQPWAARSIQLAGISGVWPLGHLVVLAFAPAVPVLVALAWYAGEEAPRRRIVLGVVSVISLVVVLLSTYAATAMGTVFGCLAVPIFGVTSSSRRPGRITRSAMLLMIIVGLIAFLSQGTPQGAAVIARFRPLAEDASASYRLYLVQQGIAAFQSSPLIGMGAFRDTTTVGGYLLAGHNTYVMAASEFGLLYLIPFLWLLLTWVRVCLKLLHRVRRSLDQALAIGITAGTLSMIFMGFFTATFDGLIPLSFVWLFLGLATVWNDWLERDPDAILVQ